MPTVFYPLLDAGKRQLVTISGNPGSNGPFAPLVRVVRDAMGVKEFNQFRGKMISLHSQGMLVIVGNEWKVTLLIVYFLLFLPMN